MSIKTIRAEDLRRMNGLEGLILQGCGGSLDEWVDGINEMLTESEILREGTKFTAENCRTFEHDGLTGLPLRKPPQSGTREIGCSCRRCTC